MTLSKEPATVERLAQRKKKVANNKEIEQEMEKYLKNLEQGVNQLENRSTGRTGVKQGTA